ncbi:YgaP family membrane protein [Hydrogenivirga sp.]
MKKNMGTIDRIIRVVLAVIFIALAVQNGGAWWILGILGVVFLFTSVVGFCPLYVPLGIKTTKEA